MKRKNTILIIFLLLSIFLSMVLSTGCSGNKTPNYPVTAGGITIDNKPEKVVSLSPSISEIVYMIGAEKQLVARSENDAFNGSVRLLPSAGTSIAPNVDKIIELFPSIVLSPIALSEANAKILTDAGIKIAVLPVPKSVEEVKQRITSIGNLIAGNNKGAELIDNYLSTFNNEIEYVKNKLVGVTRPTGVFVLSADGSVATGDSLLGEIMSFAGVDNIAANETGYTMSQEKLLAAKPQVVICTNPPGIDVVKNSKKFNGLAAVQAGNIYEMDYEFADRYNAEITYALYAIAYAVHPDAMAAMSTDDTSSKGSSVFTPSLAVPKLNTTGSSLQQTSSISPASTTSSK